MKLLATVVIGLVLQVSASQHVAAAELAAPKLTFNIYGEKDDFRERAGLYPTYALVEKGDDGHYSLIEVSANPIRIGNERQEAFFISNGYTNLAPAWSRFSMTYVEDPRTGERRDYSFDCGQEELAKYKKVAYSPCNSAFASHLRGVTVVKEGAPRWEVRGLDVSLVAKVASETDVIAKARQFNAGTLPRISAAETATSTKTTLEVGETWLVRPRYSSGDSGRFLFKPVSFLNNGDPVTAERDLKIRYMDGLLTHAETSYSELAGYKTYKRSDDDVCTSAIIRFKSGEDRDARTCAGKYQYIFRAYKGGKGVDVTEVVGLRKRLYGGTWEKATLKFMVGGIDELSFLTATESAKYE